MEDNASTGRCGYGCLKQQIDCLNTLPFFTEGLGATNSMILVLNGYRQIIFANKAFLNMVEMKETAELFGKRPGEIIGCVNAVNGCGMAEACRYCNAINITLKVMACNKQLSGESSIIIKKNGYENSMNFSIYVSPLQVEQETFYIVSLADTSDAVRRRMLERTFFHDIINTVGGLKGIIGLLKEDVPKTIKPEVEFVENSFLSLIEEIENQKDMLDAENDQLMINFVVINSAEVLHAVSKLYEGHEISVNKTIKLDESAESRLFYSDLRLLRRTLGNMTKNALEASDEGGVVTLGCNIDDKRTEVIKFWVHNTKYMSERTRSLVFHRSFSTKGSGRGLGTYSMKVLGENYLKGKVGFLSNEEIGTIFYIELPFKQTL